MKLGGWCCLIAIALILWLATMEEEDFARSWEKVNKE